MKRSWLAGIAAMLLVIAFSCSRTAGRILDSAVQSSYRMLAFSKTPFYRYHFVLEKSTHVAMYFLLGFLLSGFYAHRVERPLLYTLGTGFLVGIGSELLQFAFPGRDPAVRDVLINFFGTSLGALAFAIRSKRVSA